MWVKKDVILDLREDSWVAPGIGIRKASMSHYSNIEYKISYLEQASYFVSGLRFGSCHTSILKKIQIFNLAKHTHNFSIY